MNTPREDFEDSLEAQLARLQPRAAMSGLREKTLAQIRQELRSSRRDRRLGRLTALLLAIGVVMNVFTINKRVRLPAGGPLTNRSTTDSIAELAVSIAQVTDIETASMVARQMAALNGVPLGSRQAAAVEHEIDRRLSTAMRDGKDS